MKPKNALEAKKGLLNDRSVKNYTRAKKSTLRAKKLGKQAIRKPSVKSLKAKAWSLFSEYTRRRYARPDGLVECVTCGIFRPWNSGMQAGHFIDGRSNAVLFDEKLVYPQCMACNVFLHGSKVRYTLFMQNRFGIEAVNQMLIDAKKVVIRKAADYLELIEEYQLKLEGLK